MRGPESDPQGFYTTGGHPNLLLSTPSSLIRDDPAQESRGVRGGVLFSDDKGQSDRNRIFKQAGGGAAILLLEKMPPTCFLHAYLQCCFLPITTNMEAQAWRLKRVLFTDN